MLDAFLMLTRDTGVPPVRIHSYDERCGTRARTSHGRDARVTDGGQFR
jgi:hypothetical protein